MKKNRSIKLMMLAALLVFAMAVPASADDFVAAHTEDAPAQSADYSTETSGQDIVSGNTNTVVPSKSQINPNNTSKDVIIADPASPALVPELSPEAPVVIEIEQLSDGQPQIGSSVLLVAHVYGPQSDTRTYQWQITSDAGWIDLEGENAPSLALQIDESNIFRAWRVVVSE